MKTVLGVAAVTTGGPLIGAAAIEAGPVTTAAIAVNAADFIQGVLMPSPPPPTPAGYSGFIAKEVVDLIRQP